VSFSICEEIVRQALGWDQAETTGKAAGSSVNAVRARAQGAPPGGEEGSNDESAVPRTGEDKKGKEEPGQGEKGGRKIGRRASIKIEIIREGGQVAVINSDLFANCWRMNVLDKAQEHHRGTREWVFDGVKIFVSKGDEEVVANGDGEKPKTLFWLMGGGGTGKSVTIAVVCKRCELGVG